jgi:hypothetical protein
VAVEAGVYDMHALAGGLARTLLNLGAAPVRETSCPISTIHSIPILRSRRITIRGNVPAVQSGKPELVIASGAED